MMGYLSCRAESSVATCRSASASDPAARAEDDDYSSSGGLGRIRRFSYSELESATRNFSDNALLGRGSHGAVYKAVLRTGGRPVAVKRPSRRHPAATNRSEVENEIDILSHVRDPRLVNLIGFASPDGDDGQQCPSRKERLLVVEFMPNGTLYELLHCSLRPPGWARRLRLALQTAKALRALHAARPPVIHRDVKSANVLLDARLHARLGDFGLALRDSTALHSTPPAGTLGYLDPGYVTPDHLSTKTDVFSFGILLLEIISGRKAIDVAHSPPSVVEWAVPLFKKGKVLVLYDPRIPPPRDPVARRQLVALAASCVRSSRERRPSMAEVVEQLSVLSKAVPERKWSNLSVGNPCSVVDIERALSKLSLDHPHADPNSGSLVTSMSMAEQSASEEETPTPSGMKKVVRPLRNSRRVFTDAAMRRSVNLKDLMACPEEETIPEQRNTRRGSQRTTLSRARTLHAEHGYYDRNSIVRLQRNRTLRATPVEILSKSDEIIDRDRKLWG